MRVGVKCITMVARVDACVDGNKQCKEHGKLVCMLYGMVWYGMVWRRALTKRVSKSRAISSSNSNHRDSGALKNQPLIAKHNIISETIWSLNFFILDLRRVHVLHPAPAT